MTDPGFGAAFIGFTVTAAIQTVIQTARNAAKCEQECQKLAEELDKVLPRVRTFESQMISRDSRYEAPFRDWLDRLKAKADEANIAVHKCNSNSLWPLEVAALRKELKNLHAEVEKLVEKDTIFALYLDMHEQLSHLDCHARRHSSPANLGPPTSLYDYNTQAQGHGDMYNSVGSHSLNHTAQGYHQPIVHSTSLDDIHSTRFQAMQREKETRRREQQQ